jgi:predicted flap endonuclease-1-like 5' DNA nuclease
MTEFVATHEYGKNWSLLSQSGILCDIHGQLAAWKQQARFIIRQYMKEKNREKEDRWEA